MEKSLNASMIKNIGVTNTRACASKTRNCATTYWLLLIGIAATAFDDRTSGFGDTALLTLFGPDRLDGFIWGVPSDSKMFKPRIISGRALLPGDGRAILLNSKIAADEGFQVGDQIEVFERTEVARTVE